MMGRTVFRATHCWLMARRNSELDALRKQVLSAQNNASKKLNRLESKGVELAGTKYDPRKPAEKVNRYTRAQLQSQLAKLETFTSRRTQFAVSGGGDLLTPKDLQRYREAENRLNRRRRRAFEGISHVLIPGSSTVTVADRQKIVTPDRPHAGNPAANPYVQIKRKPSAFTSADALKKMTKALEKKLGSDFLAKDLETDRRVANEMATTMHRPDIVERLNALSDKRFNLLWNFTRFSADLSAPYAIAKTKVEGGDPTGKNSTWYERRFNENLESAVQYIDAVEQTDLTPKTKKKK